MGEGRGKSASGWLSSCSQQSDLERMIAIPRGPGVVLLSTSLKRGGHLP